MGPVGAIGPIRARLEPARRPVESGANQFAPAPGRRPGASWASAPLANYNCACRPSCPLSEPIDQARRFARGAFRFGAPFIRGSAAPLGAGTSAGPRGARQWRGRRSVRSRWRVSRALPHRGDEFIISKQIDRRTISRCSNAVGATWPGREQPPLGSRFGAKPAPASDDALAWAARWKGAGERIFCPFRGAQVPFCWRQLTAAPTGESGKDKLHLAPLELCLII